MSSSSQEEENIEDNKILTESGFNDAFMKLISHSLELSQQEQLVQHECKLLDELIQDFELKGRTLKQSLRVILNKSVHSAENIGNSDVQSTEEIDESISTNESLKSLCQKFRNCLSAYNKQVPPRLALGGDADVMKSQLEDVLSRTAPLDDPESLCSITETESEPP